MDQILAEDLRDLLLQTDSKASRLAIETLITIHRNIKQYAGDPKYTKIKTSNQTFFNKIWRYKPAADFIQHAGWRLVSNEGQEIYYADYNFLDVALQILLENRNVTPSDDEWDENTKLEGKSGKQLREEELKRKAMEQRDKELAAFLKDKKEREILAEYIKAEHKADRDRLKCLKSSLAGNDSDQATKINTLPSSSEQS